MTHYQQSEFSVMPMGDGARELRAYQQERMMDAPKIDRRICYQTYRHPTSGDVYAVCIDPDGVIAQAAGPLYYGDFSHLSEADLHDYVSNYLANQPLDDTIADGAWLEAERIER